MNEIYRDFPIRDHDAGDVRTLDLLQAWGPPMREAFRVRLRRGLKVVAGWLRTGRRLSDAAQPPAAATP